MKSDLQRTEDLLGATRPKKRRCSYINTLPIKAVWILPHTSPYNHFAATCHPSLPKAHTSKPCSRMMNNPPQNNTG